MFSIETVVRIRLREKATQEICTAITDVINGVSYRGNVIPYTYKHSSEGAMCLEIWLYGFIETSEEVTDIINKIVRCDPSISAVIAIANPRLEDRTATLVSNYGDPVIHKELLDNFKDRSNITISSI